MKTDDTSFCCSMRYDGYASFVRTVTNGTLKGTAGCVGKVLCHCGWSDSLVGDLQLNRHSHLTTSPKQHCAMDAPPTTRLALPRDQLYCICYVLGTGIASTLVCDKRLSQGKVIHCKCPAWIFLGWFLTKTHPGMERLHLAWTQRKNHPGIECPGWE